MVSLHATLQLTLELEILTTVSNGGSVTVKLADAVQPFESVTVTVYIPAQIPVCTGLFGPALLQVYVYGSVPPDAVVVSVSSHAPLQLTPHPPI